MEACLPERVLPPHLPRPPRGRTILLAIGKAAADALTAAGLGPAYNILDGFEGGFDAAGHRSVSGWKNAGLPWRQG